MKTEVITLKYKKNYSIFIKFFKCFLHLFFGSLLLFSLAGCRKSKEDINYILITLDTQRTDFISAYNPQTASTPNIDNLAEQGTLYKNCFSLIPITLPSHASIFFSKPPHEIKNYNNGQVIPATRKQPSFASLFQKNGYLTSAFVSLGVLKQRFGLAEGFDLYSDEFPDNRWYLTAAEVNERVFDWLDHKEKGPFFMWVHYSDPHEPYYTPDMPKELTVYLNDEVVGTYNLGKFERNDIVLDLKSGQNEVRFDINNDYIENPDDFFARFDKLEFPALPEDNGISIDFTSGWSINKLRAFPFFLKKKATIAITNSSSSQKIQMTFRGKPFNTIERTRELYKNEVEYMDREIGKFLTKLKDLGLMDKTHILVVGDHGEGLGDYSNYVGNPHIGHIHFLQNVYLHVPLIIYNPFQSEKGTVRQEYVTLLDIAPTVMDTMNIRNVPKFSGRNLNKLEKDAQLTIFQETYMPEAARDKFAIIEYPWHMLFTPQSQFYQLYNLQNDFDEKKEIYEEEFRNSEITELKQKLDEFSRRMLRSKEEVKIGKDVEEMLKALGYIK